MCIYIYAYTYMYMSISRFRSISISISVSICRGAYGVGKGSSRVHQISPGCQGAGQALVGQLKCYKTRWF